MTTRAHAEKDARILARARAAEARVEELEAEVERLHDSCSRRTIDAAHLAHQRVWSRATFGPGARTLGVIDHIRKELGEIEAAPEDVEEWVDVVILAFDGAWRAGWEPQQIIDAIHAKQAKNEQRTWPDWRDEPEDRAIEHVRDAPAVPLDSEEADDGR